MGKKLIYRVKNEGEDFLDMHLEVSKMLRDFFYSEFYDDGEQIIIKFSNGQGFKVVVSKI